MRHTRRDTMFTAAALLALLVASACGGNPPTDELMAAAEAVGNAAELAEPCAPEEYRAAQRLLADARAANEAGDYDRALTLAQAAREQAERARLMAQANLDDCEEYQARNRPQETLPEPELTEEVDHEFIPVYFGFDAYSLDRAARETIQRHANFLSNNSYRVIIEGHCDHHGTDQYNLALGEARARTVAQHLVTLGIEANRLSTISYGEFRPASDSDTSLNRRAEFRVRR